MRSNLGRRVTINSAPVFMHPVNSLPTLVLRGSNVSIRDRYRRGYYGYNWYPKWNDSFFFFSGYVFSPFTTACVVSPWYYYTMLPAYIAPSVCSYRYMPSFCSWTGTPYYWNQTNWAYNTNSGYGQDYSQNSRALDNALGNLQDMFVRHDVNDLQRLTRQGVSVPIFVDGHYQYTLDGSAYYALMRDNVINVNTTNFVVLDVRRNGDQARVVAEQDFTDAWGFQQRVYQSYIIENRGGDAFITQFGTSQERPW